MYGLFTKLKNLTFVIVRFNWCHKYIFVGGRRGVFPLLFFGEMIMKSTVWAKTCYLKKHWQDGPSNRRFNHRYNIHAYSFGELLREMSPKSELLIYFPRQIFLFLFSNWINQTKIPIGLMKFSPCYYFKVSLGVILNYLDQNKKKLYQTNFS